MFDTYSINRKEFLKQKKEEFLSKNSSIFKDYFETSIQLKEAIYSLYSFLIKDNEGLDIQESIKIENYTFLVFKIFNFKFVINDSKNIIYNYESLKPRIEKYNKYYSAGIKNEHITIKDYRDYFNNVSNNFKERLINSNINLNSAHIAELAFFFKSTWETFIMLEGVYLKGRSRDEILRSTYTIENSINIYRERILSATEYTILRISQIKLDSAINAKKLKEIVSFYFQIVITNLKRHFYYTLENNPYWEIIERFEIKLNQLISSDDINIELTEREIDIKIEESRYQDIITTIQTIYQETEKTTESFKGRNEDQLRAISVNHLNSIFKKNNLSATAESKSGKGKTDILVKNGSEKIFIGECKIWSDQNKFKEAINQLFGYLPSQQNRGCLIHFNQNKNFEDYLNNKTSIIEDHPKCLNKVNQASQNNSFISYKFIHPEFENEVIIDFLSFHFPK